MKEELFIERFPKTAALIRTMAMQEKVPQPMIEGAVRHAIETTSVSEAMRVEEAIAETGMDEAMQIVEHVCSVHAVPPALPAPSAAGVSALNAWLKRTFIDNPEERDDEDEPDHVVLLLNVADDGTVLNKHRLADHLTSMFFAKGGMKAEFTRFVQATLNPEDDVRKVFSAVYRYAPNVVCLISPVWVSSTMGQMPSTAPDRRSGAVAGIYTAGAKPTLTIYAKNEVDEFEVLMDSTVDGAEISGNLVGQPAH